MERKYLEEHVMRGTADLPIGIYEIDAADNGPIPAHYHKEFELLVLTEGNAKIGLDGEFVYLKPSEGVFVKSGALHSSVDAPGSDRYSFIAIVFSPEFVAPEYDRLYEKFVRPILKGELDFPAALPDEAVRLVIEINDLFKKSAAGYELAIKADILRILSLCVSNAGGICVSKPNRKSETVKEVIEYIHENYQNPLTLDDLAFAAHTSREYLCRIFREAADVSPIVYLNRYRVMQSAYMLSNTDKTISEVSSLCGFNSSSYYNKMFMRFMRCTPTRYRRPEKDGGKDRSL